VPGHYRARGAPAADRDTRVMSTLRLDTFFNWLALLTLLALGIVWKT
jgi:hypothetical protein